MIRADVRDHYDPSQSSDVEYTCTFGSYQKVMSTVVLRRGTSIYSTASRRS